MTEFNMCRHADDYCVECSTGGGKIRFGIYACSPEDSSFRAVFTDFKLQECQWQAHDGQPPDEG